MPAPESGDELTRFVPVQLAMPRRNVKIRQGSWNEEHWGYTEWSRQAAEASKERIQAGAAKNELGQGLDGMAGRTGERGRTRGCGGG
jgi:hypothetical protein